MSRRHALREQGKLALRRALLRADLSIGRDPFVRQVARTLAARRVEVLLDVGANEGQYAALVRAAGFAGRIVSVEPLPDAYERLTGRLGHDPRWQGVRAAVGAEPGTATINVSANSYSSSLLPLTDAHLQVDPASQVVRRLEVPLTTVDEVCREHDLDPSRALLKVDTQGFESEVLDGAGALLDRFAAVQLEVSYAELYTGQASVHTLTERLAGHGLVPWTWEPGISSAEGRLLQADVLFVRA